MVQPQLAHRPPRRTVLEAYTAVTTATYTAKAGDRVIGVNRSGAVTITLPTTQVNKGRVYTIKDESGAAATNNITVDTEGSENIDGAATDLIDVNYESKSYYSDGANWFILPVTPDTNTQIAQATQAALEAETNEDTYAPPDLMKHSPGMAKAWVRFDGTGTPSITASYNIASITDNAVGDWTVNFTTAFSSTNYGITMGSSGVDIVTQDGANPAAASCRHWGTDAGDGTTKVDLSRIYAAYFGDQ